MARELFVGIDLHKCQFTVFATDREGNKLCSTVIPTKCRNRIRDFFAGLVAEHDRVIVAVESVGFYQWFWDLVRPLVSDMHLADASQVRAAAGRKAKTDARTELLANTWFPISVACVAYLIDPNTCGSSGMLAQ